MPSGFGISERVRNWAVRKGFSNLEEHLEGFKLSCQKNGYRYIDWDAAFMDAVRKNWAQIQRAPDYSAVMARIQDGA